MSDTTLVRAPNSGPADYEIAFGAGGTVALLGSAGAYSACHLAGLTRFRRIGGASGGAVFACVASTGLAAPQALRMTIETSFDDHVNYKHGIYKSVRRGLRQLQTGITQAPQASASEPENPDHREWPVTGLLGTCGLGHYIRQRAQEAGVDSWPDPFWTIATTRDGSHVIFNNDGVFMVRTNGQLVQLSSETPPIDIAVRYSATIPGVMAALEYKGMLLFDGSLSRDGLCPVGVLIRNFGADPTKILALRVMEDSVQTMAGRMHRFWRSVWQVEPDFNWGPETAGVIEFRPNIDHLNSLKFGISEDEKWLAVLVSMETTLTKLAFEGILEGDSLYKARSVFKALGYWRDAYPAPIGAPQLLAQKAEAVFVEHGLY